MNACSNSTMSGGARYRFGQEGRKWGKVWVDESLLMF